MPDDKTITDIKWIEGQLEEIETVVRKLDPAIEDYLQWMAENGYAEKTLKEYAQELNQFKLYIKQRKCTFEDIFTHDILRGFKKVNPTMRAHAIRGLSRYLYEQGSISRHLRLKEQTVDLPQIYEDYLIYQHKTHQACHRKLMHIRTVLVALHAFVENVFVRISCGL